MFKTDSQKLREIEAELDKAIAEVEKTDIMTVEAQDKIKDRLEIDFITFCHKLLRPESARDWGILK